MNTALKVISPVHPATSFIRSLSFRLRAFKCMTPEQQKAVVNYMVCDGDGAWADTCGEDISKAVQLYGDTIFGVGKFVNDDAMKIAFALSCDTEEKADPVAWFDQHCLCNSYTEEALPVIMNPADDAPEFGLFESGHEAFYGHWAKEEETEFVMFLPDWNRS